MAENLRFENTSISVVRTMKGDDDNINFVFQFHWDSQKTWFHAAPEFEINSDNFWIKILEFGLLAPITTDRRTFSHQYTIQVKNILTYLFEQFREGTIGSMRQDGEFLGLRYADDWILEGRSARESE